ncbi:hypothetical protein Cantr_05401 [Candida viswanathii]|uniref:Uncharacterized protein n=1 Tax=Candida viswanathii TaxID=5486 RepID=A0A367XT12_9ASCO|nr:hypothetical protein Cantr_05401 [Candida viswanathii]
MLSFTAKRVLATGYSRQALRFNSSKEVGALDINNLFKRIDQVSQKAAEKNKTLQEQVAKAQRSAPRSENHQRRQNNGERRQYDGQRRQYDGQRRQYNGQKYQYEGERGQYGGQRRQYDGQRRQYDGQRRQNDGPRNNRERLPQGEQPRRYERRQHAGDVRAPVDPEEAAKNLSNLTGIIEVRPRRSFEAKDNFQGAHIKSRTNELQPRQYRAADRPRAAPNRNRNRTTSAASNRRTGAGIARDKKKVGECIAPPIDSIDLVATELKPKIKPEHFFYGKVPSVTSTVTARLASVAKMTLTDSQYPYKLPKDIINMAPLKSGNPFLLQKSWRLDVDQEVMKQRVKTVVLGQVDDLKIEGEKTKLATETLHDININPNLSKEQKQEMFDIVNGVKGLKTLFNDAHWRKQASEP